MTTKIAAQSFLWLTFIAGVVAAWGCVWDGEALVTRVAIGAACAGVSIGALAMLLVTIFMEDKEEDRE